MGVFCWKGKPAEELTREELIDIVLMLSNMLQEQRNEHSRQLGVLTGQ